MKVRFYALLREITGLRETTAITGDTVLTLLKNLCRRYGDSFTAWVFDTTGSDELKQLSGNVIILVNGRAIEHLRGLETLLIESDEVAIFPRMAGG